MKIALDMDEVLVEFVEGLLEIWNARHGTHIRREEIKSWQLDETFGKGSYAEICEILSTAGFFEGCRPKPGALEGVQSLLEDGHQVVLVTHVDERVGSQAYSGKRAWRRVYLPELEPRDLFFVTRKNWIDADVLVDDAAHNIEEWAVEAGRTGGVLFDAPWNQTLDLSDLYDHNDAAQRVVRARSWTEVLDHIAWLAREPAGKREPWHRR